MRHISKPNFNTKDIIEDCAKSYRSGTQNNLGKRLLDSLEYIQDESLKYDAEAQKGNWAAFYLHDVVNNSISADEMSIVYNNKFVKASAIRSKYYDPLMALAIGGKCPICGIGQVSTLDHYLAKSLYPTYAITPYNLVPVCRDCNFEKHDEAIEATCAPLHPYYDDMDSYIWLKADIVNTNGILSVEYSVNKEIAMENEKLFLRLNNHMLLYSLGKAYSIQASTEIAENTAFWRKKLKEWGEKVFLDYLKDSLKSKEEYQRNTWNTALLRALIENVDILNE